MVSLISLLLLKKKMLRCAPPLQVRARPADFLLLLTPNGRLNACLVDRDLVECLELLELNTRIFNLSKRTREEMDFIEAFVGHTFYEFLTVCPQ